MFHSLLLFVYLTVKFDFDIIYFLLFISVIKKIHLIIGCLMNSSRREIKWSKEIRQIKNSLYLSLCGTK